MVPTALACLTAFLSGLLLFALEPLVARLLLPRLGGSASVWSTCVAFFQTLLFGATFLALVTARLPVRGQAAVHVFFVLAAIPSLPVALPPGAPPPDGSPAGWVLIALAVAIGPVFFALSATSSLMMQWVARGGTAAAASATYAASNAGSLLALLGYPLIEAWLGLDAQNRAWRLGYVAFAGAFAGVALGVWRRGGRAARVRLERVPARDLIAWAALAMVPCSLSLAVTTHLAHEVPSVPLLWVVPLALYLLSLVIAFGGGATWVWLAWLCEPLLVAMAAIVVWVPVRAAGMWIHLAVLFACALSLHGRLAARAPGAGGRAAYVLAISAGGAIGGLFNAIAAPWLFPIVAEYPLALVAACLFRAPPEPDPRDPPPPAWTPGDALWPLLLAAVTCAIMRALPHAGDERDVVARVAVLFVAAGVALLFRGRPVRFGLGLAAVLAGGFVGIQLDGALVLARSHYGASRVVRERLRTGAERVVLVHGSTIHGGEVKGPGGRPVALAYHASASPLGQLFADPERRALDAGVVGLGAGALAAHARPGDAFTFYEIDPVVARLAQDPAYFTFLASARGRVRVVMGDGRLSLARAQRGQHDVLVLDAFTSDAVPVHLLIAEAFAVYLRALRPDGLLMFNTSNRHVDLAAVVTATAAPLRLAVRVSPTPAEDRAAGHHGTFAALARDEATLERWLAGDSRWRKPVPTSASAWTDDHAPLLEVLRW